MSEDEDCDGLPSIFVNSSGYDAGAFSIPSADELASQREREVENERKLKELRERLANDDDVTLARHDSSSSESDAALAAAVTVMSVDCALAAVAAGPPRHAPRAADLLAALARGLPAAARPLLEDSNVALRLPEVVASASALVAADDEPWTDDEVWALGALLAGAALAHDPAPRREALRALHTLLERRATAAQAHALGRMMLDALPAARTRLELSDALRAGGGPTCEALATLALDVALVDSLDPPARGRESLSRLAEAMGAGWARLAPELRYTTLQLLGRRLAVASEDEREARSRLLAPLAPSQIGHDTQAPEKLKVLVCASKLRLLFGTEK
ncbi:unnamed protein product [Arctia plantaginis]|uniref:Uncharacterized protein n=1 Tax=Arctia plantaginis TaxID=874455 RepID=A0A8S1BI26_ARCPL|nr:unnamed protein product [Arctia plantaginis]CAB3258623.1 unnamed protein product [Arctia plantaginis]